MSRMSEMPQVSQLSQILILICQKMANIFGLFGMLLQSSNACARKNANMALAFFVEVTSTRTFFNYFVYFLFRARWCGTLRAFRTGKQAIQLFCSAASFSLRGGRVPSKVLFTAKHLTVFGPFRIALSKRRGKKKTLF